jgi:PAS domain-containing protein
MLRKMDEAVGFLESELDRAVAAFGQSVSGDNVVPIENARSQTILRERERRFRELLDSLPAAVYTLQRRGCNLVGLPASTRLKRMVRILEAVLAGRHAAAA